MVGIRKLHRKPSLLAHGAEILAKVGRQTPASPGRTKQHVPACEQGLVLGRGSQQEDPAAEREGAWWAAQPPVPAGTVQRGGGFQLEEVGSCDEVNS